MALTRDEYRERVNRTRAAFGLPPLPGTKPPKVRVARRIKKAATTTKTGVKRQTPRGRADQTRRAVARSSTAGAANVAAGVGRAIEASGPATAIQRARARLAASERREARSAEGGSAIERARRRLGKGGSQQTAGLGSYPTGEAAEESARRRWLRMGQGRSSQEGMPRALRSPLTRVVRWASRPTYAVGSVLSADPKSAIGNLQKFAPTGLIPGTMPTVTGERNPLDVREDAREILPSESDLLAPHVQSIDNPILRFGAGLGIDLALDPLTYFGVGAISSPARAAARKAASKAVDDAMARTGASSLDELPADEWVRINNAAARARDEYKGTFDIGLRVPFTRNKMGIGRKGQARPGVGAATVDLRGKPLVGRMVGAPRKPDTPMIGPRRRPGPVHAAPDEPGFRQIRRAQNLRADQGTGPGYVGARAARNLIDADTNRAIKELRRLQNRAIREKLDDRILSYVVDEGSDVIHTLRREGADIDDLTATRYIDMANEIRVIEQDFARRHAVPMGMIDEASLETPYLPRRPRGRSSGQTPPRRNRPARTGSFERARDEDVPVRLWGQGRGPEGRTIVSAEPELRVFRNMEQHFRDVQRVGTMRAVERGLADIKRPPKNVAAARANVEQKQGALAEAEANLTALHARADTAPAMADVKAARTEARQAEQALVDAVGNNMELMLRPNERIGVLRQRLTEARANERLAVFRGSGMPRTAAQRDRYNRYFGAINPEAQASIDSARAGVRSAERAVRTARGDVAKAQAKANLRAARERLGRAERELGRQQATYAGTPAKVRAATRNVTAARRAAANAERALERAMKDQLQQSLAPGRMVTQQEWDRFLQEGARKTRNQMGEELDPRQFVREAQRRGYAMSDDGAEVLDAIGAQLQGLLKGNARAFTDFFNAWGVFFKGTALASPGRQIRDTLDDGLMAWVAGARNPKSFTVDAPRILFGDQNRVWQIGGQRYTSAELRRITDSAGVTDAGRVGGEVAEQAGRTYDQAPAHRFGRIGVRRPGEGRALTGLREFSTGRENIMRMGLFLERLRAGDDILEATQQVRKFLYDYQDLAPALKGARAFFIPFLTFTWKTMPLLLKLAYQRPGFYSHYGTVVDHLEALGAAYYGDEVEREGIPDFRASSFQVPLPQPLRPFLAPEVEGASAPGEPVLWNPNRTLRYGLLSEIPGTTGPGADPQWQQSLNWATSQLGGPVPGLVAAGMNYDTFRGRSYFEGEMDDLTEAEAMILSLVPGAVRAGDNGQPQAAARLKSLLGNLFPPVRHIQGPIDFENAVRDDPESWARFSRWLLGHGFETERRYQNQEYAGR